MHFLHSHFKNSTFWSDASDEVTLHSEFKISTVLCDLFDEVTSGCMVVQSDCENRTVWEKCPMSYVPGYKTNEF